jgi:nucleotide-binding universal stress UspA family protein
MFDPKHILLPVVLDPSEDVALSKEAMSVAVSIAARFKAKVSILYVASLVQAGDASAFDISGTLHKNLDETLKLRKLHAQQRLEELKGIAKSSHIKCEAHIVTNLEPSAKALIDKARTLNTDLLVVYCRGQHGISQLLFGSLAEEIATLALIPVLVIHPKSLSNKE